MRKNFLPDLLYFVEARIDLRFKSRTPWGRPSCTGTSGSERSASPGGEGFGATTHPAGLPRPPPPLSQPWLRRKGAKRRTPEPTCTRLFRGCTTEKSGRPATSTSGTRARRGRLWRSTSGSAPLGRRSVPPPDATPRGRCCPLLVAPLLEICSKWNALSLGRWLNMSCQALSHGTFHASKPSSYRCPSRLLVFTRRRGEKFPDLT